MTAITEVDIQLQCHDSIDRLTPGDWDALLSGADVLHTHRFNRVVERAAVENAVFRYVALRQDGVIVATATLSIFDIDLGLFLGKTMERWLERIRRFFPTFLKIRILVCGLPASFGQANLSFSENVEPAVILEKISALMDRLALEHGAGYCCFKEFDAATADRLTALENLGYFRAFSLPDTRLDLQRWANFDDYLRSMRHPYRRKIALSLRKLGLKRPEIYPYSAEKATSTQPVLLFGSAEVCSAEQFYGLYLQVMARAETKLETLNLAFFEELYRSYADELVVLALYIEGRVSGAVLLLPAGDTLLFLLIGQEQARSDATDTYFNLVYGILAYTFRHGFRAIKTGQTAYPFKLRLGAMPGGLFLYFKAKNRLRQALLRRFRALLFPETRLKRLRVFLQDS